MGGDSPWRIWKERWKKGGWQEFLPSWFHAWQVVSLFLFLFFFIIRGPDTENSLLHPEWIRKECFLLLSFFIVDDLERMSTCNNFFLSNDGGGKRRRRSKIILLTFHASFPPITTPHSFSRKREIDLETSQRVKLLCFAILRGVV